jgi:hypothetical protein
MKKENNKFKVGDIVMIDSKSEWYNDGEGNPANVEGIIVKIEDDCEGNEFLGICVKWTNNEENSYSENDLVLIK